MMLFNVTNPFKKPDELVINRGVQRNPGADAEDIELTNNWMPPVDVLENNSAYFFNADLPGLKPSDVRVVRIDELLLVSGERNLGGKSKILRQERSHGHFFRRLPLPADASRQHITAVLSDGVLRITARRCHSGHAEKDYPSRMEIAIDPA